MDIFFLDAVITNENKVEAAVAQGYKVATVNAMVVCSSPTRGNEIFNVFISALW